MLLDSHNNLKRLKLTINFIGKEFEKEGYILLTKKYINNRQKLEYICSKGHKHKISWSNWKKNARCPYCSKKAKKNIKLIKSEFAKEDYNLLTKTYENAHQKLDYICSNNHRHRISWAKWQSGRRCPYCAGVVKLTVEFIRAMFKKENYILLTTEYRNAIQKLDYICPKGHRHSISWSSWYSGHRCPYCGNVGKPSFEFIKSDFEKEGYTFLTTKYKNSKQKLKYVCPNEHKHSISWGSWCLGQRCPYCSGKMKKTICFIKKEFEKEDYKLLSTEYVNAHQKLDYICPKNHRHSISWTDWQSGKRCGVCKVFGGSGRQNGCWKGGISCEPYCQDWTKEFKNFIKERDGYKCMNPDCWKNCDHLPLTIHHIDYHKKNCHPQNLITLCVSCNSRANKDRGWHKVWYKTIIYRRYVCAQ